MPVVRLDHVTVHYTSTEFKRAQSRGVSWMYRARLFGGDRGLKHAQEMHPVPEFTDRAAALNDLNLTIFRGETLSIVGPSGCGKTTLLKVIAGIIEPEAGSIYYDGVSVREIPPAERGIGMVFQNYALYPHRTARDNIGFYDLIQRHPEKIPDRLHHISEVMEVDLKYLLKRRPPQLSGGEQQQVAVARCLARDPKIFLFDEPLANLDAKLRASVRVKIKRLLQHYRITTVYVTHDQTEAAAMGDRVMVMNAGQVVQIGTYHDLYDYPHTLFVASFIGNPSMNLFSGYLSGDTFVAPNFTVAGIPLKPDVEMPSAVHLGIHAAHVEVLPPESPLEGLPARVEHIEYLYSEQQQILYTRLHGQSCAVRVPLSSEVKRGEGVRLHFPTAQIHLFNTETGLRV